MMSVVTSDVCSVSVSINPLNWTESNSLYCRPIHKLQLILLSISDGGGWTGFYMDDPDYRMSHSRLDTGI